MRILDANVLIRYLTQDDPVRARAVQLLFERVDAGQEQVAINEIVVAEVIYVLTSRSLYGLSRSEATGRIMPLLTMRNMQISNRTRCLRALEVFTQYRFLDFADAFVVAQLEDENWTAVYSYDQGLDRIDGVVRIEP